MSPIAFDTTIIEQNTFESVENNGLTKDSTKPFTSQEEQPQQQQPPQQQQEQKRNNTFNLENQQKDKETVQTFEDIMQVDELQEPQDNSSLEPKPDLQTSPLQQLPQLPPQPVQGVQATSSQVQLPNPENVEICTSNSSDMEDI